METYSCRIRAAGSWWDFAIPADGVGQRYAARTALSAYRYRYPVGLIGPAGPWAAKCADALAEADFRRAAEFGAVVEALLDCSE